MNKALMIADNPLLPTGVGTVTNRISRYLISHGWRIFHIGGSLNPPDSGRIFSDISGREIMSVNQYGNIFIVRQILKDFKPDVVWIMTDPRFFIWLWSFEEEIREVCPLVYYHVWDNYPVPRYNYDYYESCDSILCISKLTYDIVNTCKRDRNIENLNVLYCPHGVDTNIFRKLKSDEILIDYLSQEQGKTTTIDEFKRKVLEMCKAENAEFILFWNNKNMTRKRFSSIMEGFSKFAKDKKDVLLLAHTDPITDYGTDLYRVREDLFPDAPIVVFSGILPEEELVKYYNIASFTVNIASAEGFGLSSAESMACGTPVINSMTGGLQDQVMYEGKEENLCGIPVPIRAKNLVGHPITPYIYDDFCDTKDIVEAFNTAYDIFKSRNTDNTYHTWSIRARKMAEDVFNNELMCSLHLNEFNRLINEWTPSPRYHVLKV